MLLSLIPLALVAQFPGGSANDLCAHLATETKRPVVVVKSTSASIGPFQYDPADVDSINRALRAKAALELTAGSHVIVHDGLVLMSRMAKPPLEKPITPKWVLPNVENGKVTLETKGQEALDPMELDKVKFSKPVKVHWFYEKTPVSAQLSQLPEREFLTYIAKGIGARFSETEKEFKLSFDPSAMRNRLIKTVGILRDLGMKRPERSEEGENDPMATIRPDFVRALLTDASLGELTDAFATPESKVHLRLRPNGRAIKVASEVLDTYLVNTAKGRGTFKTPAGEFILPLKPDTSKPMTATLSAKLGSSFKLTVYDANGKSLGELGFEFDGLEY